MGKGYLAHSTNFSSFSILSISLKIGLKALTSGIPLRRPMIIAFALSGFCAGFAGTVIGLKSGTAQGLGLQYLLLAGTVAAFVDGVSILGGKGGVLGELQLEL